MVGVAGFEPATPASPNGDLGQRNIDLSGFLTSLIGDLPVSFTFILGPIVGSKGGCFARFPPAKYFAEKLVSCLRRARL
jgi:hypothetical protein